MMLHSRQPGRRYLECAYQVPSQRCHPLARNIIGIVYAVLSTIAICPAFPCIVRRVD